MHVKLAGVLLTLGMGLASAHAQGFNKPYDIGMNGGNPGASQ